MTVDQDKRQQNMERAYQLRLEGYTHRGIADELGVTAKTASEWVLEYLEQLKWHASDRARMLREEVLERDQELIRELLRQAKDGNLAAVDRLVKVQDQMISLTGAAAPIKTNVNGTIGVAALPAGELEKLVAHAVADLQSGGYEVLPPGGDDGD